MLLLDRMINERFNIDGEIFNVSELSDQRVTIVSAENDDSFDIEKGDNITIENCNIFYSKSYYSHGNEALVAKLGFDAPRSIKILRQEVLER